ncbi:MAG: lytic transglycosylase domain-containing protein [Acidobacteria bacterium]|nr:lytic transglycosylase domain-containing protein [Acidobacteriota bacterium]
MPKNGLVFCLHRLHFMKFMRFFLVLILTVNGQASIWDTVVRRAAVYESAMIQAGKRWGVDPRLLWAIGYNETKFVPTLRSPVGALGMMQFMPGTAARFGLKNPFDPLASIEGAARYLSLLQRQFPNRPDLLLAAYNAGEVAVRAYLQGRTVVLSNGKVINGRGIKTNGVPPYRETQGYVKQGMAILSILKVPGENATVMAREEGSEPPAEEKEEVGEKSAKSVRASIYLYGDEVEVEKTIKQEKKGSSIILYR